MVAAGELPLSPNAGVDKNTPSALVLSRTAPVWLVRWLARHRPEQLDAFLRVAV